MTPTAHEIAFWIPGKAVGYYAQGARPNWDRLKSYRAYKMLVQVCAKKARVTLPLHATEAEPVFIRTQLYSAKRVHHDPENVHKGIVDALFYGAKGGDKHVGGTYAPAIYDGKDAAFVWITFGKAS